MKPISDANSDTCGIHASVASNDINVLRIYVHDLVNGPNLFFITT